jgi:hypothetical protein
MTYSASVWAGTIFGRLSPVGRDPVDPVAGVDVLAQQADGHSGEGEGVGGVDSQLRVGGGMGGFAGIADAELLGGDDGPLDDINRARMRHHRQVRAGEGTLLEQCDLSPAGFLGGRAQDSHGEPELVGDRS